MLNWNVYNICILSHYIKFGEKSIINNKYIKLCPLNKYIISVLQNVWLYMKSYVTKWLVICMTTSTHTFIWEVAF